MAEATVRTFLDIPVTLHQRLQEAAARKGCSARQLILRSLERAVAEGEPQRPLLRASSRFTSLFTSFSAAFASA